jgi:protein-L-isoaspartate O-methyltransferase
MTDIFTHAIMINAISSSFKSKMSVLDIGTGHGYLSFLIEQILSKKGHH